MHTFRISNQAGAARLGLLGSALVVVALLVAASMVVWTQVEPSLRVRAERAASERLRTDVEIGNLRPGAGRVLLSDVSIAELSRGVELHVESMTVSPRLSSLIRARHLVVEGMELDGVDAFLSRRRFGPPNLVSRLLPEARRLLSVVGLSVNGLEQAGVELAPDAEIHLTDLRLWLVVDSGEPVLVHEEPEAVLARTHDKLVLRDARARE